MRWAYEQLTIMENGRGMLRSIFFTDFITVDLVSIARPGHDGTTPSSPLNHDPAIMFNAIDFKCCSFHGHFSASISLYDEFKDGINS